MSETPKCRECGQPLGIVCTTTAGPTRVYDFSAPSSAATPAGEPEKPRRDGVTDDTAAIQAAINAAEKWHTALARAEQEKAALRDRLTFAGLRAANVARLPLFKNRKGGPAHSEPDGSDWSLGDWSNAVLGELGEAANLIKKVQRGDLTLDEARSALAKEFADVVTYLDILAFRCGVDLGNATAEKWDEVSERVGVALRIADFDAARTPTDEPEVKP